MQFKKMSPVKVRLLDEILTTTGDSNSCARLLDILVNEGSLDEAVKVYYLFDKSGGYDRKPGQMLARACADAGDVSNAIKIYKKLTRSFPHHYTNYKELEKLYLRIGKPESAIALYKGIGREHPLRQKSYKRLTGIYSRLGEIRRAVFYLRREIKEHGASSKRYKELGKLYMADKKYVKAIQAFQNALAHDKDDCGTRIWLGLALMENGNYELAEYEFRELLSGKPHGFQELIHMAELRIRENRLREAQDYLEQVDRHYPDNSRVKLCRAEIAFLEGRHEEAARLGEVSLRQTPFYYIWEQMRCHRLLKHAYRAMHDPERSRLHKEMQNALKKPRDVFGGLIRVAELKIKNGKTGEGRKILKIILDLYPGNAHARVALSELFLLEINDSRAVEVAEDVLKDTAARFTMERSRAHAVLAKAYGRLHERKKAAFHRRQRNILKV